MLEGLLSACRAIASLAALALASGCSAAPPPTRGGAAAEPPAGDDQASGSTVPPGAEPGGARGDAASLDGPLAVVAIDAQATFFDTAHARNPKLDVAAVQATTARVFALAAAHAIPLFVTFEASTTGDHALPPALASALPPSARTFVKTTFDATGQPDFLAAIRASGAKRVVVLGAETDVCVMQSSLGLRRAGFDVITLHDALFTEEVHTSPALRRMRQAGIVDLPMSDVEPLLAAGGGASPAPAETHAATTVRPFQIGVVLHDLEGLGAADPNASPKTVRLRQLLLVTEWFGLPVFADDPASALAALPADARAVVERPLLALASRPASVTQLALAGGRDGIGALAATLASGGVADVFVLDDVLVGTADLAPLYARGAMPSTYKSLYYELIHSVDDSQWPSQEWVTRGASYYYDATMAPESLPPLAGP
ncbi:MAG TPA: isochorismatase family protein [Labilithrix sp.]